MATTYGQLKALIVAQGGQDSDLLADTFKVTNSEPPVICRRLDSSGVWVLEMRNN